MNALNNDSKPSMPTLHALSETRMTKKPRRYLGLFLFVAGLCSGVLVAQFTKPDGTFSAQAGVDALTGVAADTHVDAGLISQIWEQVHQDYVNKPIDDDKMIYTAIQGLVAGLGDQYSVFFPPTDAESFLSEIQGQFEGIGAEIGLKKERMTVIAPLPDSPAEKAGMRAGDHILAVDGTDVGGMSVSEVVALIRGEKGTIVKISLSRQDSDEVVELEITRDTIQVQSVKWAMLPDTHIAKIEISSFSDDTVQAFQKAVGEIVVQNPSGVILDLRNNPGGYLDAAVDVAGSFLAKGDTVLIEQHGDGQEKEYRTDTEPTLGTLPVVVLVNQGSASAAEILAGALKDQGRATLLGETTFGKGSVQDVKRFADGSLLKLTIAHWLTPNKTLIQDTGIDPDHTVTMAADDFSNDRDPQLDAAKLFLTDRAAFDTQYTVTEQ